MAETIEELKARIAELEEKARTQKNKINNVKTEVDNNGILIIEIDLNKSFGLSKSGKATIVATTGGFEPIPDAEEGFALNLNVVKKK